MRQDRPTNTPPPIEAALPGLESTLRPVLASLAAATDREATHRVLFVSAAGHAGTSTVAASTAIMMARYIGASTTLIEADIYSPSIHKYLNIDAEPGLLDILDGKASHEDALRQTDLGELSVLTGGGSREARTGELAAPAARRIFDELGSRPGLVIIDAPPVLEHADAAIPIARADEVYLVVRAAITRKEEARRALDVLRASGADVKGVILNDEKKDAPWPLVR